MGKKRKKPKSKKPQRRTKTGECDYCFDLVTVARLSRNGRRTNLCRDCLRLDLSMAPRAHALLDNMLFEADRARAS